MTDATEKTDYPTITVEWTPDGVAYNMHNMSGPILHGIAAVLHHEAEKLLFHADMQAAQKAGGKLVDLGGRKI